MQISIDPNAASHPFATWDTASQQWQTASGQIQVLVGNASDNLSLSSSLSISK